MRKIIDVAKDNYCAGTYRKSLKGSFDFCVDFAVIHPVFGVVFTIAVRQVMFIGIRKVRVAPNQECVGAVNGDSVQPCREACFAAEVD